MDRIPDGVTLGIDVGCEDCKLEGHNEGMHVGVTDGFDEGDDDDVIAVGCNDGVNVGKYDGIELGEDDDGNIEGADVGV